MMLRSKKYFSRCTVIFIFIVLSSCGIDTIAYLSSKVSSNSRDESSFVFSGPVELDASYLGVFIFYRIYDSDTVASNDYANLYARQNVQNAVPGRSIEPYLLTPNGLNYKKLVFANESPIPTLNKNLLNTGTFISINFPSNTSVEPILSISSNVPVVTVYNIQRNIPGAGKPYLSFRDRPQTGQDDYTVSTDDPNPNEYFIQFFAATYGIDLLDINELYGDAVYLGTIKVYF